MSKLTKFLGSVMLMGMIITGVNCASLSEGGKQVRYVTKEEAPKECKMLPETVAVNYAFNQEQMIINMRNDVAEKGGNYLVVDTMAGVANQNGGVHWSGTGRGFNCP